MGSGDGTTSRGRRATPDAHAALRDVEAERAVLGNLLLRPSSWAAYATAGAHVDVFSFEPCREVWNAAAAIVAAGGDPGLLAVKTELQNSGAWERIDRVWFAGLVDGVPSLSTDGIERIFARLDALASARRSHAVLAAALQAILERPIDVGSVIADLRPQLAGVAERVAPGPILTCLADVEPEAIKWTWRGFLAGGKLSLLAGDPGLGKSTVSLDLAARLTRGRLWPDGAAPAEPGSVVLLSAEDGVADTLRPRLDALGADVSRVHVLEAVRERSGGTRSFSLARDIAALEEAIVATGASLVVIDPVTAYLGGVDAFRDDEIRGVLEPLQRLAERTGVAVLLLAHLNKNAGTRAIYRVGGSIGLPAACRLVFIVARDPDRPERRLMMTAKANIAADGATLAFGIVDGVFAWESGPVEARDLERVLRDTGADDDEGPDVCRWLRDLLADGAELDTETIIRAAGPEGHARRSIFRAANRLQIVRRHEGRVPHRRTYWSLPSESGTAGTLGTPQEMPGFAQSATECPECHDSARDLFDDVEVLG